MSTYTLDFAPPTSPPRQSRFGRRHRYPIKQTFRRIYGLLCGLLCGIALVGLQRQYTQTQMLRTQYQAQTIQYDSLLTAKLKADQQLERLRIQVLNRHYPQ